MKKKHSVATLDAIEQLLDNKLDEKLSPIQSRLDTIESDVGTLTSDVITIKSDVGTLKSDVQIIKDVVENKVYKELQEGFERMESLAAANIEDHLSYDRRLSSLEINHDSSTKN